MGFTPMRSFVFQDANSFVEKTIVVRNISEVSSFFVAIALTLDGKVLEAIPIFEHLLSGVTLQKRVANRSPQVELFHKAIRDCLQIAYLHQLHGIYDKHIVERITAPEIDDHVQQFESKLKRIEQLSAKPQEWVE